MTAIEFSPTISADLADDILPGTMQLEEMSNGGDLRDLGFAKKYPRVPSGTVDDDKVAVITIKTGYQMPIFIFVTIFSAPDKTHVHV